MIRAPNYTPFRLFDYGRKCWSSSKMRKLLTIEVILLYLKAKLNTQIVSFFALLSCAYSFWVKHDFIMTDKIAGIFVSVKIYHFAYHNS